MTFANSQLAFLYRQFFVTPPPPSSGTSLVGKTGIITGSNIGLGYYAASQVLSLGLSRLIMAVRNTTKGEAARKSLLAALENPAKTKKGGLPVVEVWPLDLSSYSSIVAFTERLKSEPALHIDFAILNAGIANFSYETNPSTGHEMTVQTNWLSTGLLSILLLPILQSQKKDPTSPPAVLSIVGSEVAQWAAFKEKEVAAKNKTTILAALDDKKNFDPNDRYYTSKLLLLMFFREFHLRAGSSYAKDDVVVNIVNPGFCYGSELHRSAEGAFGSILGFVKRMIGRSSQIGARTLVHGGALAGRETDGKYLSDCAVALFADYTNTKRGQKMQSELWDELAAGLRQVVDINKVLSG